MAHISPDFHHKKSFRIKHEDDKFFTKLLSKETSKSNSSFRVYYNDVVTSTVPFTWETRPGTPKLNFLEASTMPPLTPPPSYYNNLNYLSSKKMNYSKSKMLLHTILRRMSLKKHDLRSSPSLSSFSSSSYSSSSYNDPMISTPSYVHRGRRFSSWGGDERAAMDDGKINSENKFVAYNNSSVFFMKKAFLSIVANFRSSA